MPGDAEDGKRYSGGGRSYGGRKGPRKDGKPGYSKGLRDGDRKPYRRDGDRKPYDKERKPYPKDGEGKPYRRDGEGKPHDREKRPYDKERKPYDRDKKPYQRDGDRRAERGGARPVSGDLEKRKHPIPQDPQKLLYKGIDLQIQGKTDIAMIMFLHGAVMMSEGCSKNAERIIDDAGKEGRGDLRGRIAPECTDEALVEFDYICISKDAGYPRQFFDEMCSAGSIHAIYRRICLGEVEGDDPIIDTFARAMPQDREKVMKGLEYLVRKKDSESAQRHIDSVKEMESLRQYVNSLFVKATKGKDDAREELATYAGRVPDADFFLGFLEARDSGNGAGWLKGQYPENADLIISKQAEFGISDDPFGKFLIAKNLQSKKEEWVPAMMTAAQAGSAEAVAELMPLAYRTDVARGIALMYAEAGDLDGLMSVYAAGYEDTYMLDKYCDGDGERILRVAYALRPLGRDREIAWLRNHAGEDQPGREALIDRSREEEFRCKAMLYALHDVGADMEAAELYFEMEGAPDLPSFKWLEKLCSDDSVKEYIRQQYEARGDTETFDKIFEDDGYVRKHDMKRSGRGGFGKGPRRDDDRRGYRRDDRDGGRRPRKYRSTQPLSAPKESTRHDARSAGSNHMPHGGRQPGIQPGEGPRGEEHPPGEGRQRDVPRGQVLKVRDPVPHGRVGGRPVGGRALGPRPLHHTHLRHRPGPALQAGGAEIRGGGAGARHAAPGGRNRVLSWHLRELRLEHPEVVQGERHEALRHVRGRVREPLP